MKKGAVFGAVGRMAIASGLALGPLALSAGVLSNRAEAIPADAGNSTPPNLGGWNVSADANVIDITADNTTGLAGIHPLNEADFPEAQSVFETGPFGSGLATVFWPGAAGGNFGSLSSELGLPSQLQPVASQLNDPARAAAQYPSGPTNASYPPGAPNGAFDMQSQAGAGGTTATSDIASQTANGIITFASAKSTSSAMAQDTANATATSTLSDLSILGLVDIGSIQSTATAASDGNNATGSATTHVTGVTVMGQPASIGSDGLVLPNLPNLPVPSLLGTLLPAGSLNQVINALGLTITTFPSTQTQNGQAETVTSGGLQITISPPPSLASVLEQLGQTIAPLFPPQAAIIPTLPGLLQGLTLTITIGRATASASASPPFNDSFNPGALGGTGIGTTSDTSAVAAAGSPAITPTGLVSAATGGGSAVPAAAPNLANTPTSTSGTRPSSSSWPSSSLPSSLIKLSSPLAAGVVVGGLAVAGLLGYGLWRLGRLVLVQDSGPVCPLGQDVP
jgi:hypothetical protein